MKAQIFNNSWWIHDTDPERLKTNLNAFLAGAEFGIEGEIEHHFQPQGYTCLWLLTESHLAVHTFPEEGKSYVELSSCVKKQFNIFCNAFKVIYGSR